MKRRDMALLGAGIVLALILAFPMRPLIWELLVLPIARLWWQIVLLYRSVPQQVYWILLILIFLYIAFGSFSTGKEKRQANSSKRKRVAGQVEALSQYIAQSQRGVYFRWSIARSLGLIASSILEIRGTDMEKARKLSGKDWSPPESVQAYLEAGLHNSFANFPQNSKQTPFDIELEEVVSYLEAQLETNRDRHK